jgi:hypothetical protein
MGGGSSRYEETDWPNASGKLLSPRDTVDGSPPTTKHGQYTITKQGINQRDFDVVDGDCNLLYTTQIVEGTLAWFDVLGVGIANYVLRVQVDLTRRYWVIYRYGQPAYPGQFADMYATMKLRELRGDSAPCLYKAACITVSWSRYYAIVCRYGSPPLDQDDDDDDECEGSDVLHKSTSSQSLASIQDGKIKAFQAEMETNMEVIDTFAAQNNVEQSKPIEPDDKAASDEMETIKSGMEPAAKKDDAARELKGFPDEQDGAMTSLLDESFSSDDGDVSAKNGNLWNSRAWDSNTSASQALDTELLAEKTGSSNEETRKAHVRLMKKWKAWAKKSAGMDQPPPNPLEGYLLIHEPILKCEEVNSFMGQHQTMLISLEEAKILEEADAEAANQQPGAVENQDNVAHVNQQATKDASTKEETEKPSFPRIRKLGNWLKTSSHSMSMKRGSQIQQAAPQMPTSPVAKPIAEHFKDETLESARKSTNDENVASVGEEKRDSCSDFVNDEVSCDGPTPAEEAVMDSEVALSLAPLSVQSCETSPPELAYEPGVEESKDPITNEVEESREIISTGEAEDTSIGSDTKYSQPGLKKKAPLEPLVGYWIWDNTMQVHKMKMTVAKDSDLALHVVLAVVTNQLRLERNVLLTTV